MLFYNASGCVRRADVRDVRGAGACCMSCCSCCYEEKRWFCADCGAGVACVLALVRLAQGGARRLAASRKSQGRSFMQGGLEEDDPGVHDPTNPEGSILMNRLKRQIRADGRNPKDVDIVEMTQARRPCHALAGR